MHNQIENNSELSSCQVVGSVPPDPASGVHPPVNLASLNNNSNPSTKKTEKIPDCSNSYAKIIFHNSDGSDELRTVHLRCGSWGCPDCAKINSKILRQKTNLSMEWFYDEISKKYQGFRFEYFFKFLTLTLDGNEWRKNHSIEYAEQEIKKNWNKLRSAIIKKYGKFEYIWVMESQKDGYPHMHVVMIGKSISPPDIKEWIYKLWKSYGMGFSFIKQVYGGTGGITAYITKYITKELQTGRKGSRVYSMSKEMKNHSKVPKNKNYTVIEVGHYKYDSFLEKMVEVPFYSLSEMTEWEIQKFQPDRIEIAILHELETFFEEMGMEESKPKQRKLEL